MIATHTAKMFNARLKVSAVCASIVSTVPPGTICSQTTNARRTFWAAPSNAADIKLWRDKISNLPEDFTFDTVLPEISDPQLKQLLVPLDWRNKQYACVTPVASMGVIHEMYQRLYEQNLPFRKWVIQPTPAAMANHGEALLMQSGEIRLLRRGPSRTDQGKWKGTFVQLTARCEGMNISSGMLAVGFPAITAIGGYVHSLERQTGQDLAFAFGMKSANWVSGVPKAQSHNNSYGAVSGRAKGSGVLSTTPSYATEEIVANCEIVLLLKVASGHEDELKTLLKQARRLAGGSLFDVDVSVVVDGAPPVASYLFDASKDIIRSLDNCEINTPEAALDRYFDPLQAALDMYSKDGEWCDGEWYQPKNGYTVNHTGYAFLEQPVQRAGARADYPHSWVESTFSLITQGSMTNDCWWSSQATNAGVFWGPHSSGRRL